MVSKTVEWKTKGTITMRNIIIILFFIFSAIIFAQPNVKALPEYADMTFEQITTMFPDYYVLLDRSGYGRIIYHNTYLPGSLNFLFTRNRCYAMQYLYSSEDSVEARQVYEQYLAYVTERYGINGYLAMNWGDNNVSLHHFWTGRPLGWGAVMFDGSRMHYTHITWDGYYYLVWMSMFRNENTAVSGGAPKTKPKVRL